MQHRFPFMPNQIWFQLKQSPVFSHQHSFWCSRRRSQQLQWEVQLLRDDSPGFSKWFSYMPQSKSQKKQASFWSLQKLRRDWLIWLSFYTQFHIITYKYTLVCTLLCSPICQWSNAHLEEVSWRLGSLLDRFQHRFVGPKAPSSCRWGNFHL